MPTFEVLEEKFEEYLKLANLYLFPFYLTLSEIMLCSDDLIFKHYLAIFGGIVFTLFLKSFYPEEMKQAKKLRKYVKNYYPKLYAYLDGTIRYLESWSFFARRGLPFASSYALFFLTWLFTT